MPLHGKIVVINRSGSDGSELPLKAPCLFGRNPDSDIRIRIPQVSKEHCRIDLNENKELILTNLSSVNPTLVNGEPLLQAERLKHGDVITIIDRCFRFEYPPPRTPSKRSSLGKKSETLKAQQLGDSINVGPERKNSDDDHPKDGHDHDTSHCLDETVAESNRDKNSPFSDLYQMIKKSLDIKTPLKLSDSRCQTPSSKFCTPKPVGDVKSAAKTTPKKAGGEEGALIAATGGTPQSAKKQRRSSQNITPTKADAKVASWQQKRSSTPQKFTVSEVIEQVVETPKSPKVKSREATPAKSTTKDVEKLALPTPQSDKVRRSPRDPDTGKVMSQKRKSGELLNQLPAPQMKRKRVSFGGHLSPELFDKKMPPDSPLRKGATPRRSLCISKPKHSLLRRASVIGLLKETDQEHSDARSPAKVKTLKSPAKMTPKPKTPSPQKSPKSRSTSPKAPASEKKSQKPKSPSPSSRSTSTAAPVQKSPKPKTPSPKAEAPGKMTPKAEGPPSGKSKKAVTPLRESVSSSPARETPFGKSKASKEAKTSGRLSLPAQLCKTASTADNRRASLAVSSLVSQTNGSSVVTPAVTSSIQAQTPTVQGRFSVSRISTPSPVTESSSTDGESSAQATPKIPLKRKSMKKTPKSAAKIRRSGVSHASMKAFSFADIVKFGKAKMQLAALAQRSLNKKTVKTAKKTAAKPQTPAKTLMGYASTGHAASPATIVVGRALKQKVVLPIGAPPTVVFNTAIMKDSMKVAEDLSGVSEMFKTPMNNKSRRSVVGQRSASKTPVVEQSVLNTPEETGEMVVSPLTAASVAKGRAYNSEAVKRLLNGQQDDSISEDIPPLQIDAEESGEQTEKCPSSVTTPKQKPAVHECLTGVKRIMKTPKQKPEPVEDLRGKILKTPKQKPEQPDCLTAVKRIMKTPKQKSEPIEDLRGKILKTPKQKPPQQESLTGLKRLMKTPKRSTEPIEDLHGKILKTPKQKPLQQECLTGVKRLMKTPKQKAEPVEDLRGKLLITPKQKTEQTDCLTGVKRIMRTPKERSEPVEEYFGIKRLVTSPRLPGNPPVEDFEGLQELMEEPVTAVPAESAEVQDEMQPESEPQASVEEPAHSVPQVIESSVQAEALPSEISPDVPELVTDNAHTDVDGDQVETVGELDTKESSNSVSQSAGEKTTEDKPKDEAAPVTELEVDTSAALQKKSTRGRRAKAVGPKEVDVPEEPVASVPVRGRRGRRAEITAPSSPKKVTRSRKAKSTDAAQVDVKVTNTTAAQEVSAETQDDCEADAAETESAVPLMRSRSKRGRKLVPEPDELVAPTEDATKTEETEAPAVIMGEQLEDKMDEGSSESEKPEKVESETINTSEPEAAAVQKKTLRGRRAKAESQVTEEADEPISAPVRGRRGKKAEAVKQATRGRNAKSVDVDAGATEDQVVQRPKRGAKKVSPEVVEVDSASPVPEELSEISEEPAKVVIHEEHKLVTDVAVEEPKTTVAKPSRAKKPKAEATQIEAPVEEMVVPAEKSQPPVRARRGRTAKNTEENLENGATEPQEPVQKVRKSRKQAPVETLPEEAEEPVKINAEGDSLTAKSKRACKTKGIATVPESAETPDLTAVLTVSDKPKNGRGAKPMMDVSEEVHEGTSEPEERKLRGRRVKSALKDEEPEIVPAKRARRGAKVIEEASAAEPSQEPVPAVRGRRCLRKPDNTNVQDSCAIKEEPEVSMRSVTWKEELEVHEIPKATLKKAVRGRKSKLEQNDAGDVKTAEEEKLSEELVEPQPVKRSRRGAKAVDEPTSKVLDAAQADPQPKTRRGRAVKK
ncbi:proliferation marker protein Ki-67 isoform X2 [Synchiropus splendidus]|uniref:proliferation marker protein Ki-67 isoform X2 n=1 Tax=Synchiropus splendidus TaxID=270530 RepID=UPI00237ED7E7|nr:proliferation marker protein Ki-67 isoform X2 [Synchiropus splendidus]